MWREEKQQQIIQRSSAGVRCLSSQFRINKHSSWLAKGYLIGIFDKFYNQGYCDFHNHHLWFVYFATFVHYASVGDPVVSVPSSEWRLLLRLFNCRRIRPQCKNNRLVKPTSSESTVPYWVTQRHHLLYRKLKYSNVYTIQYSNIYSTCK